MLASAPPSPSVSPPFGRSSSEPPFAHPATLSIQRKPQRCPALRHAIRDLLGSLRPRFAANCRAGSRGRPLPTSTMPDLVAQSIQEKHLRHALSSCTAILVGCSYQSAVG